MRTTVVLWDIDGTLIRSGGAGKTAMESALRSAFGVRDIYDTVAYSGRTDVAIARDLLAAHDRPTTEDSQLLLRETYLRELPVHLAASTGEVLPGIPELLNRLHGRSDVVQGLLTGNVRDGARIKLGHFGLWDYFAIGGFGDRYTDRADVAREALASAEAHSGKKLDPGDIWVVGDTPHDVSCGRAIGANVLAVATGWHSLAELEACGADATLADLSDVKQVLGLFGIA